MRALVASVVLLVSTAARAEDVRIATARIAYDNLEQAHALELLDRALAGSLADHDRAAALRLAGCAHMVLRDRAAAVDAFKQSFVLEPDAALEAQIASPDARSLFEVARGEWRAGLVAEMEAHATDIAKLQLGVHAPIGARGGQLIKIGVEVVDPGKLVARVELAYRKRGHGEFTLLTRRPDAVPHSLEFDIPAAETESNRDFTLEYHVALRHRSGFDLRRDGDADHPHTIAVAEGHAPRWHELWWVRGAIALGVVGLGAGGYLFYRSIDVGPQTVVVAR